MPLRSIPPANRSPSNLRLDRLSSMRSAIRVGMIRVGPAMGGANGASQSASVAEKPWTSIPAGRPSPSSLEAVSKTLKDAELFWTKEIEAIIFEFGKEALGPLIERAKELGVLDQEQEDE